MAPEMRRRCSNRPLTNQMIINDAFFLSSDRWRWDVIDVDKYAPKFCPVDGAGDADETVTGQMIIFYQICI